MCETAHAKVETQVLIAHIRSLQLKNKPANTKVKKKSGVIGLLKTRCHHLINVSVFYWFLSKHRWICERQQRGQIDVNISEEPT